MGLSLSQDLHPFIRYTHIFTLKAADPFPTVRPYDCRLIYVVQGKGQILLDATPCAVRHGSLLLWRTGTPYSIRACARADQTLLAINFDYLSEPGWPAVPVPPATPEDFKPDEALEPPLFSDCPIFNQAVYLHNASALEDKVLCIHTEHSSHKIFCEGKSAGQMAVLLFEIARLLTAAPDSGPQESRQVDEIIQYVRDNCHRPLTNRDIGEHFSFHPAYLSRLILKFTGYSLHRYLTHCRLEKAFNLLQTTSLPISGIAAQAGFTDPGYFAKCFREAYGLRPGDCRAGHGPL